ncbi:MAG: glycosyl transferase [Ramlibacter sp.]|nr:glycosyl transferase [Ramlibacter sp.]
MTAVAEHASTSGPAVDVLIVSFNTAHLLDRLRQSLAHMATCGLQLRLLVLDNASSDGSGSLLRSGFDCDVFIQNEKNVGFGRANNQLAEHARGDYLLLLNTDAFVSPDTLTVTVDYMQRNPRCGIVGVRLTDEEGGLQPSRRTFPTPITMFLRRTGLHRVVPLESARDDLARDHSAVVGCDWVPGCYYLVRRAVLREVGLFDPRFFLYFEEVDHCRRVRDAGWSVVYLPTTSVVHVGGESAKSVCALSTEREVPVLQLESELLYVRKHFGARGLALHLCLLLAGDAVLAMKDFLRGRGWRRAAGRSSSTRTSLRLAVATHLGSRPTR